MAINEQEAQELFGSPVDVEQGFTEPKQEETNAIPNELQYYFTDDVKAEEQGVFRETNPTPIGWENGVKPIYIDKSLPLAEQYLQLWNYRTNTPDGFTKNQSPELANKLFEEERVYYEYDGDKVKVPNDEWKITRQLKNLTSNVIHPIFGFDKEREFAFSQELVKKGLNEEQQKQIYDATEKAGYVQFPEEGDVSLLQQMENISANLYDFFPDIAGVGIWAWQKARTDTPDEFLGPDDDRTYEEYSREQSIAAAKNLELTRYWDKLRSEVPFIAPWKELYKKMIFNATEDYLGEGKGILLEDDQIQAILKEGPYVYQVARIASEAIPYVVAIEGTLVKGFGMVRGSKAYDEALEYVSKNTHRHGSPYEAVIAYMEKDAIKKKWIGNPKGKTFLNGVVKRYDKVNKKMTLLEKESIEKQLATLEKQIVEADKINDMAKLKNLSEQKKQLITVHAGLKVNLLNNYTKAMIRNEAYASSMGGACYSITGSDGIALGCELAGAVLEPNIHSSVMNLKNGVIFRTAQLIDGLNSLPGFNLLATDNVKLWSDKNMKAKFFTGNVDDLMVTGKDGNVRALTTKEISTLRVFGDYFSAIPVKDRQQIIARMEKSQEVMENLKKFLPEDQHKNLKMTIAEMTGLSVLNALDELTKINMKVTNMKPTDLIAANQNLNQSKALIEAIDNRVQAMLGSTPNPSEELLDFGKKIESHNFKLKEDLIAREEGLMEILEIYSDSLYGGSILDNLDKKSTNYLDTIKMLEEFAENAKSPELKQLAELEIDKIYSKTMRIWENVVKDSNGISNNYVGGYTVQDYMASEFYDTLMIQYRHKVSQAYTKLDEKAGDTLIDVTDSYKQLSDLIEKNSRDNIGKLGNKLPPGHFNNQMMEILEDGANNSLNKYLVENDNARVAFAQFIDSAPEKTETMIQAIETLVQKQGKFNAEDLNTVFNGIADTLSKTEKYKSIGVEGITKLDVYQALRDGGVDIAINLKPSQAMDLRSSLSTLKSKAFYAGDKGPSLNYDTMLNSIEKSVTDSLPTKEAKEAYANAINLARDYHVRFDNPESMLSSWSSLGAPISYRQTENLQDGTVIVNKIVPENANSKKIKNELGVKPGTDSDFPVPNFKHSLADGEFIPWAKILNDPVYAKKWMRDVVEPLIGRPVRGEIIENGVLIQKGDNIVGGRTHILDLSDPEVFQRAQIFKKLLEQELGSFMSLSDTGKLLMDTNSRKKVLELAREKKITMPTDLKINNSIDEIFQISDDFNLLNVDKITRVNLGFENAQALNKTIREYNKKVVKEIKKDKAKASKIVKRKIRLNQLNIEKLSEASIVAKYGSNLANPTQFYKVLIEGGNVSQYKAVKASLTEGDFAVMKPEEFDEVAKTLYRQWYLNFSNIRKLDETKIEAGSIPSRVDEMVGTMEKGSQAIAESTGKVKIYFKTNLGEALNEFEKNKEVLDLIYSKESVASTKEVLQMMAAKAAINIDNVNLQNMPKALSVESWISRIYSINRGVISPRYVLTEAGLQQYRVGKTDMMIDLLSNPDIANIVKNLIQNGLSRSPYLDLRLQKFFKAQTVNAILLNEVLSEGGELDPGTEDSWLGSDSTIGKAIRAPFQVEERL